MRRRFAPRILERQTARIVVTVQMYLDLVILGLVARLVVNAVKVGKDRQVG